MWKPTINYHLKKVFADIKSYNTEHYNLAAVISAAVTGKIEVRNWDTEQVETPMEASA
jgi:hypothetical protein